jgi:hypothetical protein
MNWNYWLPWRDYPQDGGNDSSYEEEVIDRCRHRKTETRTDETDLTNPTLESGHVLFDVFEIIEYYCEDCGVPLGTSTERKDERVAVPAEYYVDGDVDLEDALEEPEEDDEPGRVLVSQSDDAAYGLTD